MNELDIVYGLSEKRRTEVAALLRRCGLRMEEAPDVTALIYDVSNKLAATGSRCGHVIKYIAVDESLEGEGACALVTGALVTDALNSGVSRLFICTKPKNAPIFRSLGFYELVRTADAALLENKRSGLDGFLRSCASSAPDAEAGAVVVNCNPLTNGHMYLFERAAAECAFLHIFVVSEDRSRFPAAVRYELVRRATAHITNAAVHHSDEYLISAATLPAYFIKDAARADEVRFELDIELFASRIAPALNIKKRFVGTELYCALTRAYNEKLKAMLPPRGVELIEIQRKDGISASRVRELMDAHDYEAIRPLVPDATYEYIKDKGSLA